jgi:hypothetical protein
MKTGLIAGIKAFLFRAACSGFVRGGDLPYEQSRIF